MITEEMIRAGRKTSLGGIVSVQRIVEDGVSTMFLHSAIRMEKEDFIEGEKGEHNFHRLKTFFAQIDTRMSEVFSYENATFADDYGVFTFSAPEGFVSLAELQFPVSPKTALAVFKALLEIINTYRHCDMNAGEYRPMLFICPESVYVQFDENENLKEVRLLPLPFDTKEMYAGMPNEVAHGGADLSSDVYMAAYLYLLMKYTNEESFDEALFSKCDYLAEQCISPFKLRRPCLSAMLSAVENDGEIEKPENNGEENWAVNVQTKNKPQAAKPKKAKSTFFGIKKSKLAKQSKETMGKAKDKFDDMFSTEEADEAEED